MTVEESAGDVAADQATESMLRASRALVGVAARSLADLDDITLPQFRALVVLSNGATTVSGLAASLDIHPSTATRLCDRLVRKGLIRRAVVRGDRRSTELVLAAGGRRLVERVTERRRRDLRAIAARLPDDVRSAAVTAFAAFADAAGEPPVDLFGWAADGDVTQ